MFYLLSVSLVLMGGLVQKYENMFTLPYPSIPFLGKGTYHRFAPIFLCFVFWFVSVSLVPMGGLVQKYENMFTLPNP